MRLPHLVFRTAALCVAFAYMTWRDYSAARFQTDVGAMWTWVFLDTIAAASLVVDVIQYRRSRDRTGDR